MYLLINTQNTRKLVTGGSLWRSFLLFSYFLFNLIRKTFFETFVGSGLTRHLLVVSSFFWSQKIIFVVFFSQSYNENLTPPQQRRSTGKSTKCFLKSKKKSSQVKWGNHEVGVLCEPFIFFSDFIFVYFLLPDFLLLLLDLPFFWKTNKANFWWLEIPFQQNTTKTTMACFVAYLNITATIGALNEKVFSSRFKNLFTQEANSCWPTTHFLN
jgi:hypothetical protein